MIPLIGIHRATGCQPVNGTLTRRTVERIEKPRIETWCFNPRKVLEGSFVHGLVARATNPARRLHSAMNCSPSF
jgi:hypothetical protein